MSKYYVGQMLDVIKYCGFEVGYRLPITEIMPNGDIVIDSTAAMPIHIVNSHFKPVGYESESIDIKSELELLRNEMDNINNRMKILIESCKHEDLNIGDKSSTCNICGHLFVG